MNEHDYNTIRVPGVVCRRDGIIQSEYRTRTRVSFSTGIRAAARNNNSHDNIRMILPTIIKSVFHLFDVGGFTTVVVRNSVVFAADYNRNDEWTSLFFPIFSINGLLEWSVAVAATAQRAVTILSP